MIGSVYDVSDQWEKNHILVIAFGARPTFGGGPPNPPSMQEDVGKVYKGLRCKRMKESLEGFELFFKISHG